MTAGTTSEDPGEPTQLDDLVPSAWPSAVADALDPWRQGDLVREPKLSWLGPAAADSVTGIAAGEYDWEPVADEHAIVPYGIVCSQTCDLGSTGPGAKHPFVQIAPVVRRDDVPEGLRNDIRNFKVVHQFALPVAFSEGFWLADLRLIMPASKALLAAADRLDAFGSDEEARLAFSEVLARKFRRPALHDALSSELPRALDAHLKARLKVSGVDRAWHDKVNQVRVAVTEDRLAPDSATLYVISDHPLSSEERNEWRSGNAPCKKLLKVHGIVHRAIQFTTLHDMSAATYVATIPVSLDSLGRPPMW